MDFKKPIENIKKFWNWVWNSDSILSWIVALVFIYVFVKFIFFPGLSLIMGTSLPLAGVESSSMSHQIIKDDYNRLNLCGNIYSKDEYINFGEYWAECGNWYENKGINKKEFSDFPLKNGFNKGDIIVVWGRFKPEVGDVVIFKPNEVSKAPRPIIHRIVEIKNINNEKVIETKGDHNEKQLEKGNNIYNTDETKIYENQLIGKAIFKIPYLGWIKIWFVDFLKLFF